MFALLILFFLRGIVNSPHSAGVVAIKWPVGMWKKLIFFQFIVGKMAVH